MMQSNQLYPTIVPSAPAISNSNIYQQGDYLPIQTTQPPVYYQHHPVTMSPGRDQFIQPSQESSRQWSIGLCDCFSDIGECCLAFLCPLCYQIRLFNNADETCCSCVFGGLVPLRTKIRMKNNIEGSICADYFTILCCTFCSVVQMGVELKKNPSH